MHIIFFTRCYRPTNIQKIKDNLKEVFANQNQHTYQQYLVVDLTHRCPAGVFEQFKDNITHIQYFSQKKDYFNYSGIDKILQNINKENIFIYMLDDDNLIKENFPHIFDNYDNEDMIVFKSDGHTAYKDGIIRVGGIDLCNYITKLEIAKQLKIYNNKNSYATDGIFACRVKKHEKKIKYLKDSFVIYSALPKP